MELIYKINFNSTNFYFKDIIDNLILESKTNICSKMFKGFILLICNDLEENIKNNVREKGEFQLTSCMDRLRIEDGFMGYMVKGKGYDIGLPKSYLETLGKFNGK